MVLPAAYSAGSIWPVAQGEGGAQVAKVLADSVIPNEYGIDPEGKLKIGSKICTNLLGKILSDLQNMREESLATAVRAASLV